MFIIVIGWCKNNIVKTCDYLRCKSTNLTDACLLLFVAIYPNNYIMKKTSVTNLHMVVFRNNMVENLLFECLQLRRNQLCNTSPYDNPILASIYLIVKAWRIGRKQAGFTFYIFCNRRNFLKDGHDQVFLFDIH